MQTFAFAGSKGAWYCNSPGTLTSMNIQDNGPVQRISFKPQPVSDPYWCESGFEFTDPGDGNVIEFRIKASEERLVSIKLYDSSGYVGYYNINVKPSWTKVELHRDFPDFVDGGKPANIQKLSFIFYSAHFTPGTEFSVYVSALDLKTVSHKPYIHHNWMPAKIPPPVKGYRIETCIWNTWTKESGSGWGIGNAEFNGFNAPEGAAITMDVTDRLIKEYKYVGMDMPIISGDYGKVLCSYIESLGGLPVSEGHNFMPKDFLEANNAYAINIHGQNGYEANMSDKTCTHDMTHPAVLKALQERILDAAKAGSKSWRTVDYVWQWWGGGIWGYSDSAIKRWRENLSETDAGIEIIENGKHRKAYFGEYFESYHGYRPKPIDMGLKSWDEYNPPKADAPDTPETQNTRKIFNLLFHYEWVKFINEAARPSASLGLLAQPICNPEGFATGTDLYWLFKCAFVEGFAAEWWGGADVVLATYYNGRYYDNAARSNGKEIIFLGESSAAGGSPFWGKLGRPNYWDNMANYLITYSQSASVDAKAKHDQYWGSSWKQMSDPNSREYQSFTAFKSAWAGFLQCRNDKATKPKTDLLAIGMRAITHDVAPFDRGLSNQPYNLGHNLIALNYVHDAAAFPMDQAFDLNQYKTIVYSPFEAPAGFAGKIVKWLDTKGGRTLITHSFVPSRFSAPAQSAPQGASIAIQSGGQEKLFGFTNITVSKRSAGILKAEHPVFVKLLSKFNGKRVEFNSGIFDAPGEKTLVSIDGKPLISERKCGKGRVIYLHFVPEKVGTQIKLTDGAQPDRAELRPRCRRLPDGPGIRFESVQDHRLL
ncbi:MAG: hypothetical protein ACYC27_11750, partial [Armatimonadota bacterium]